jgi:hypothetical protein
VCHRCVRCLFSNMPNDSFFFFTLYPLTYLDGCETSVFLVATSTATAVKFDPMNAKVVSGRHMQFVTSKMFVIISVCLFSK